MKRNHPNINSSQSKKIFRPKEIPAYKIVEGTNFAVDAFTHGEIPGVKAYFLSHFHSDHYGGLSSKFTKTIYCSRITGALCVKRLGVKSSIIKILETDKTESILGISVTGIDANHCPGSLMFVFELKNGQKILHVGDFRANRSMESHPIINKKNFDLIYLDTTYCNPKYDFPTQEESIEKAISILSKKKQAMESNGDDFSKLLVICGTYLIGKEKFFLGIAESYRMKIWCEPSKFNDLKIAIGLKECDKPNNCQLHILSMMNLNYEFIKNYLNSLDNTFTECIIFKPSGWENSKSSFIQRNNVTIFGIPYSEHSSFSEMKRFVTYCKPKRVITTIPGHTANKKVLEYLSSWIGNKPIEHQKKISDFFKKL